MPLNSQTLGKTSSVSVVSLFMRHVYQWMTAGLALTGVVAFGVASSPALMETIYGNMVIVIGLFIACIALPLVLSSAIHKMSGQTATGLFLLYAMLLGAMLSSVFVVYDMGNISKAFFTTAGTFLAMSVYGTVTRRDLTAFGSFLMMGLFGLIIAMIVNIFLQSTMMDFIICCLGVLIFTGLTAYDTQKIRRFGENAPLDDPTAIRRGAILGALNLYLDFINLFLMLLRLFSNRD
jgi:FtsH-binding integral membrane protein